MSRRRDSGSRVYVGNLPKDVREKEVKDLFCKYGKINQINVRSSRSNGRSFAFIEDADDAIYGRDRYDYCGYLIRVEPSNSQGDNRNRVRSPPARRNPPRRSSYRVHVSNFPSSGSWQDLKDHMRQAGEVLFADVYRDGTAVVEFAKYEDMKAALKTLDGSTFRSHDKESSQLELREDDPKSSRSRSSSHSHKTDTGRKSRSYSRSPSRSRSPSPRQSRSRTPSRSVSRSRSR